MYRTEHGCSARRCRWVAARPSPLLLDIAAEMLVDDPAASLAEVAKAAGIGRTTLHKHYATRDDLLHAVGPPGASTCGSRRSARLSGPTDPDGGPAGAGHRDGPARAAACASCGGPRPSTMSRRSTRARRAAGPPPWPCSGAPQDRGVAGRAAPDWWLLAPSSRSSTSRPNRSMTGRWPPSTPPDSPSARSCAASVPSRELRTEGPAHERPQPDDRVRRRLYREQAAVACAGYVRRDQLALLPLRPGRANPYALYDQFRARGPLIADPAGRLGDHQPPGVQSRCCATAASVSAPTTPGRRMRSTCPSSRMNPPDHTRLRRLARPRSARRPWRLPGRIERTVGGLLDAAAAERNSTWSPAFAAPLPIAVITDLLGIPDSRRGGLRPSRRAHRRRARTASGRCGTRPAAGQQPANSR